MTTAPPTKPKTNSSMHPGLMAAATHYGPPAAPRNAETIPSTPAPARIRVCVWARLCSLTGVTSSTPASSERTHTHTHTRTALQQLSLLVCCSHTPLLPNEQLLCTDSVCVFWFPSQSWLAVRIDAYMQIRENNKHTPAHLQRAQKPNPHANKRQVNQSLTLKCMHCIYAM